ncbi:hypothetical protein [Sphingobacterium sp. UBA5670]|uniref:hypothetical protein n=1 Tax=Sphingobacterium sp. UBA5670 TaxID=1947502 RepID=UPI0025CF661A|nr:hypothetical protein [Sphingobacterium sp. UBA5670]
MRTDSKLKIFEILSKDLAQTIQQFNLIFVDSNGNRIDLSDHYICPLSLRAYCRKDIDKLSIEHVPQHSLNGKPLILTDKEFNNNDGGTKDKKILNYFKYRNFQNGVSPIDAKFYVPDIINGAVSGKLYGVPIKDGKAEVKLSFPNKTVNMLKERGLIENWSGLKLRFKVDYSPDINKSALLKAAYLIAFSKLGYRLLFNFQGVKSNSYGLIIKELAEKEIGEDFPLIFTNNLGVNMPDNIGIVENEQFKLLVTKVCYNLDGHEYIYHVILPHPEDLNLNHLIDFKNIYVKQEQMMTVRNLNADYLL